MIDYFDYPGRTNIRYSVKGQNILCDLCQGGYAILLPIVTGQLDGGTWAGHICFPCRDTAIETGYVRYKYLGVRCQMKIDEVLLGESVIYNYAKYEEDKRLSRLTGNYRPTQPLLLRFNYNRLMAATVEYPREHTPAEKPHPVQPR
jgi:hypothetical protein